jgi:hypothetical protein
MIKISDVIKDVRRAIDEFTLQGEFIAFDSDMDDMSSSNFSDEDLADRALDIARHIAARVRAPHLQDSGTVYPSGRSGLVNTINPTDPTVLSPAASGSTKYPFVRLLVPRVRLGTYEAQRRTFSAHLAGSGLVPTATAPVFVYSDHEFLMSVGTAEVSTVANAPWDGGQGEPGTAAAEVVRVPYFVNSDGEQAAMGTPGVRWSNSGEWTDANLYLPMDNKFKRSIANGVSSSCFMTLRKPTLAGSYRKRMMDSLQPFLLPRFRVEDVPDLTQM